MKSHIEYWKKSAQKNWKTSLDLFKTKHYDACLFFCHLTIEKLLKGLVVQETKTPAPHTHDLIKLAHLARIDLSSEQAEQFNEISTFNIVGRYQDEKNAFHKKITKPYCEKWLKTSEKLYLWLKKEYQNQ
ncbi:MAG: hypothetical protein AUJ72_01860 [Candidatus Omnitrophica bacterium CG1_02_46_14]|nr:MAG: hypothetical protein AUJ72_01860 [Candidatus Omnitrophica bacterium CG1_02_46_14]PIR57497.1 MAG: DNA-binding protein [Parcubacteria group bacterium CG10_big_fil_rev_8_21_14_0_10_41_35]